MIKKAVKSGLKMLGFRIQKIPKDPLNSMSLELTMEGALQRCTKRGLTVNSVIDVGASDGRWSRMCM